MHQIPGPRRQLPPQDLITNPPNPKHPHRLPQPRLKHLRRPLLLRNHTNRRPHLPLPQLLLGTINSPQPTYIRTSPHKRRNQRLIIDTITGNQHIKPPILTSRIPVIVSNTILQQGRIIRFPVQGGESDVWSWLLCCFVVVGAMFAGFPVTTCLGSGMLAWGVGLEIGAQESMDVFLVGGYVVRDFGGEGQGY